MVIKVYLYEHRAEKEGARQMNRLAIGNFLLSLFKIPLCGILKMFFTICSPIS